jgi:hypothetical protein
MFDRQSAGAPKCLFFLQINKSHKVVVCVNKKFAIAGPRRLLVSGKATVVAILKSLIFVFKLEMVIASIFICNN